MIKQLHYKCPVMSSELGDGKKAYRAVRESTAPLDPVREVIQTSREVSSSEEECLKDE